MTIRYLVPVLAMLLVACGTDEPPPAITPSLNIDAGRITVSGASSGAMMATQMHVAHSSLVNGAALLSGGPYYCAEGSLSKGLGECMQGGDVGVAALIDYSKESAAAGLIDDLTNLRDDPVWLFLGSGDVIMHRDLTDAAAEYYGQLTGREATIVDDIPAAHGFPTVDAGVACAEMATPFLNACGYDAAGELLQALYGELQPPGTAAAELVEVAQPGAADVTMLPSALAYVPQACQEGEPCGVHIAFHGCQQSTAFVGDQFAKSAGYNAWAETNKLIILYPQVDSSKLAPMNPMGCWDWWGYTDGDYATRNGGQIRVVKAMLDALAGNTL